MFIMASLWIRKGNLSLHDIHKMDSTNSHHDNVRSTVFRKTLDS